MLTLLAYGMVIVFMTLIMTKRMAPLTALILVPLAFGVLAGYTGALGTMMLDGVSKLAPTGIMLTFAILFFAIMIDAGLFEPFVQLIVRRVHGDPVKVVVGTALLALLVSLDGDGSTTYMITTAAMLPLYRKLGIRPLILACVTMMAGGVMNVIPWGGPTARAASALGIDSSEIFRPMIPAMLVCSVFVLYAAYRLGTYERVRLAGAPAPIVPDAVALDDTPADPDFRTDDAQRRPGRFAINAMLTVSLMAALVAGVMPLPILFMIGFAVALMINHPSVGEQKTFLARHAGNVLAVSGLIFAAGIFTGILSGTKMVDAMAASVIAVIPSALGPYLAIVTGIVSIPFTFFISNDAFYYGVLPILAKAAQAYGISAAEMGRASVIGQPVHLLSPLVPSTYLLVGLAGVEFGDHQRFTIKWCLLTSLLMLAVGVATTVIPLVGRG
jgi:citrate-Mg2+:H+ or citrate-Ca2+:H+ symporter, CitMHS family